MTPSPYTARYFEEVIKVVQGIDQSQVDAMVELLVTLRSKGGRLFFIGVGGGAGNATHAVNDFRKICAIETYTPTDNVSELTARINDEGWEMVFVRYLETSRLGPNDAVFVLSVGGGNVEKNISANIVAALKYAKSVGASVTGVPDGTEPCRTTPRGNLLPPILSRVCTV